MSGRPAEDYLSTEEAIGALERLSQADMIKLRVLADLRASGLPGNDGDDLLQTALERMVEGNRRWPRGLGGVRFLDQVMRSIASEHRQADRREKQHMNVIPASGLDLADSDDPDCPEDVFERTRGDDVGADQMLIAKQTLREIESLFPEEHLLGVVLWRAEGYSPEEIQRELGMSQTDYETASKTIRRRVIRWNTKGEGGHG